jgi:hypothetical protein
MPLLFTIMDPDTDAVVWVLHYNPAWEIPFVTVQGTPHVWNWDFITGALLQDGQPLIGYAVTIVPEAS